MKNLLEFANYAEVNKLPFLDYMNPGIEKHIVFSELGFENKDLASLYGWKNGITQDAFDKTLNEIWFFNGGFMNPIETAVNYQYDYATFPELLNKKLITIFDFGYQEKYLYNYDVLDKNFGKIYVLTLDPDLSSTFFIMFDSLDSFFLFVLKAYQNGIWFFNKNVFTSSNREMEDSLLLETNPGTEYFSNLY